MEALEKAYQRKQQRLDPAQVTKPASVHTVNDIKAVLSELDPARNPRQSEVPLNAFLEAHEDGKKNLYKVSANTRSKSKRDILMEGLEIVKSREEAEAQFQSAAQKTEINGKQMKPATLSYNIAGRSWVDPLIAQWTGGRREGTLIVWELEDGYKYRYDIFAHRLSRVPRD